MDIRRAGYFGQVQISGAKNTEIRKGSIMGIIAESLKDIAASRSRPNADGESEIIIRIRNRPFDTSKEGVLLLGKVEEVDALLANESADTPLEGETFEEFYHRLLDSDYPKASAEYIAAQWFGHEVNPDIQLWLNDAKAIRFRLLNSNREAYEAALPQEYESLKNYVKTTYPEFVEHLTFRTA